MLCHGPEPKRSGTAAYSIQTYGPLATYGVAEVRRISKRIGLDDEQLPALIQQWTNLLFTIKTDPSKKHCNFQESQPQNIWAGLLKTYEPESHLKYFIECCLVLPSSSSAAERVFSLMTHITTSLRGAALNAQTIE